MAVNPWIILLQYIAGTICFIISLFFIVRILKRAYRARRNVNQNISPSLLLYFIFWLLSILTTLPHILYFFVTWTPHGNKSNPYIIFWTALPPHRTKYGHTDCCAFCKSTLLICTTIAITITLIIAGTIAACHELPLSPQTENCTVLACLFVKTGAAFYTYPKICFGFANVITGSLFLFKFQQTRRTLTPLQAKNSSSQRINKMVVLVICLEFFLNFLPQLTAVILFQAFGIMLGSIVGSYNLLACLDVLISSIMYSANLNREKSREKKEIPLRNAINTLSVKAINPDPRAIDLSYEIS
ncbi:hypothetical protein DdX_17249 [Ditylenchus destructor]|uniref:Uncharacterized protein n=1 Tax=Ditylenchus destructor TaxID=166010 RepID=A0AAD4MNC1_9BILA|nr:hypothetical protein DdX_17249 [Ditylenchus destructor]